MGWEIITFIVMLYMLTIRVAFLMYLPLEKTKLNLIITIVKSVVWLPYEIFVALITFAKKVKNAAIYWEDLPDK